MAKQLILSAPMAVGRIALLLEANPNQNLHDMQQITVQNCHRANKGATDWIVNSVRRNYSWSHGCQWNGESGSELCK